MKIPFFGLLYICENESKPVNLSIKDSRDQISIYVNCAINLSNSLKLKGSNFTLLTNKRAVVEELIQPGKKKLRIKEIPFKTIVPHGIRFYSAHFKFDAFLYLSTLSDDYVGFCDLDMVCINDFPHCFSNNIKKKIPMCYDISDQVIQAYGHEIIIQNLKSIHCHESEGRWSGGEFISGTPDFFLALTKEIDSIYPNYINNLQEMHHIGDEAVTSAALEILRKKGIYIADVGTLGVVGRFWNANTVHPLKSFDYFQKCFLLHLPSDKKFLAQMAQGKMEELSKFTILYNNYRKAPIIRLKKAIQRVVKMFMSKNI